MPTSAPCKLSAIDTLLTELVRSRCVDIGRVHFGGFYGPRESRDPWNAKRRTRLISSCHLGRTGLVNKGVVVYQKDVLIKTKNDLFISKAGKEGQLCLWHNKPTEVIYVLLSFCCSFLRPHHRRCPKLYYYVSSLHEFYFLFWCGIKAGNPERGPILSAWVANKNTGFTSHYPRALPAIW